jgi:type I restriction enzyme, S subunit
MNEHWQISPLDEVVKFIDYRGKTPEKTECGLRLITAKNVKMGYLQNDPMEFIDPATYDQWMTRGIPKKGDVLFTTEAPLGNVTQLDTDEKVVFAQRIIIMQPNREVLDSTFLKYMLLSKFMQDRIHAKGTGATVKGIKAQLLKKVKISFPRSLPEQKRIVSIVDEAFEAIDIAIDNTKQNLTNARELFDSYLNAIFTQKGDGWEWVTLSEITTDITDGDHQPPPKSESGIPFITISNINKQDRTVDFSNTFKVSSEYFNKLKHNKKPRQGDILYTVTGSYGIPVVVDHALDFCFQRHIGLIRPDLETNSKCLYYMLLSRHLLNQADECATGTAQKTVSLSGLRRFSVPKIPKEQQETIVAELDILSEQICRLEAIYQQKLTALNELKQSILHKAFTGELTADTADLKTNIEKEAIAA